MTRIDPLSIDTPLPLTAPAYPLGFRLEIATNSPHVLEAAAESWGHFAPEAHESDAPPLHFRVLVQPEGALCQSTTHHAQGHLYAVVGDAHNFALLDLRALAASMFISERTAADHSWLRWFFVESLAYTLLAQRHVVPVHAACIARDRAGILLCGSACAGKTTLAYASARAGWTYVTDDCVFLLADSPGSAAIGRCLHIRFRPDAPEIFPELAGSLARVRPNGRLSLELPMSAFRGIRTADRAHLRAMVFLERQDGSPGLEPIGAGQAAERLLAEMPSYGPEVNAMHERTVRRLAEASAFKLRYRTVAEALRLLDGLPIR
jgi:hypothetical protein